jgi:tetratricopeptide (TPR) repeat protein
LAVVAPLLSASGDFNWSWLLLAAVWLAAFAALARYAVSATISQAALASAALGLILHRCGAGGIEMPAIAQVLLVIVACASAVSGRSIVRSGSTRTVLALGGLCAAVFVACLLTAMLPVLSRNALLAAGDDAVVRRADFEGGLRAFGDAAAADPLSPEPQAKIAEAFLTRWQSDPQRHERDFDHAVEALQRAMTLDPHDAAPHRRLGDAYWSRFTRSHRARDAEAAAEAWGQAVERYPNEASLRAQRAAALAAAGRGEQAKTEAERALELHTINRTLEHSDRYLSPSTLDELRRIAGRPPR